MTTHIDNCVLSPVWVGIHGRDCHHCTAHVSCCPPQQRAVCNPQSAADTRLSDLENCTQCGHRYLSVVHPSKTNIQCTAIHSAVSNNIASSIYLDIIIYIGKMSLKVGEGSETFANIDMRKMKILNQLAQTLCDTKYTSCSLSTNAPKRDKCERSATSYVLTDPQPHHRGWMFYWTSVCKCVHTYQKCLFDVLILCQLCQIIIA